MAHHLQEEAALTWSHLQAYTLTKFRREAGSTFQHTPGAMQVKNGPICLEGRKAFKTTCRMPVMAPILKTHFKRPGWMRQNSPSTMMATQSQMTVKKLWKACACVCSESEAEHDDSDFDEEEFFRSDQVLVAGNLMQSKKACFCITVVRMLQSRWNL